VSLGGDFSERKALSFDGALYEPTRHRVRVRALPLGWFRNAGGEWAYEAEDERQFEVFCESCGDSDGPKENQPEKIRSLRGPYPSRRRAERALNRHLRRPD
jgi:hypothetical protein